jgi:hypothetical protein
MKGGRLAARKLAAQQASAEAEAAAAAQEEGASPKARAFCVRAARRGWE